MQAAVIKVECTIPVQSALEGANRKTMDVHDPKSYERQWQCKAPSSCVGSLNHCLYLEVIQIYATFYTDPSSQ